VVVGRVSLGLKGSDRRVCDGGVCIGVLRDDVVPSVSELQIWWPCGRHMGLEGVSISIEEGGRGVCACIITVWRG